jgi:hypothetical protein
LLSAVAPIGACCIASGKVSLKPLPGTTEPHTEPKWGFYVDAEFANAKC